jgi:hypothetical protein
MIDDSSLNVSREALRRGDWKTAIGHLPMHYDAYGNADILKHLCCVYLQAERWHDVASVSASAAQRFSHEAIFWECWAWAEHQQADSATALRILEYVVRRFPAHEGLAYSLACLYAATHQLSKAKKWLARAKKLTADPAAFTTKVATQRELKVLWTAHEHAFAT